MELNVNKKFNFICWLLGHSWNYIKQKKVGAFYVEVKCARCGKMKLQSKY